MIGRSVGMLHDCFGLISMIHEWMWLHVVVLKHKKAFDNNDPLRRQGRLSKVFSCSERHVTVLYTHFHDISCCMQKMAAIAV